MQYAVVRIKGKQHLVTAGKTLLVDRLEGREKSKLKLDEVLLRFDDKKLELGRPLVKQAAVEAEILAHLKDKKIRVSKFKAKSRYRRVTGHRQLKTRLQIVKI